MGLCKAEDLVHAALGEMCIHAGWRWFMQG